MFVLTDAERIAILSGCVGLLSVVILLTICFVCPVCWFYKLINRRKLKEDAEMKCFNNHFPRSFLEHEPPPPYESSNKVPFFDIKSPLDFGRRLTSMNSVSTVCSDTDSVTGIPLPLVSDTEIPSNEMRESSPLEPGNASITLQFKRIIGEEKKVFSQLRVDMKEAGDLPLRAYGGRCDPYFVISLYDKSLGRRKRRKPGPIPIHEFNTTVVKKNQHPMYNESFFFPLEQNQLKKSVLKIEAWDQDKWANDTALGEVFFNLKDVTSFLLQEPSKEMDLNLKLEDSKMINGQLLLGLCYLPTAERMTVAVLKANNLKVVSEKCDTNGFYVQALAMYGGKVFERRKTSSRPSSSFPVFNEMLMFDVPFSKLDNIVLLLTVRNNTQKESTIVKDDYRKATTKDACIGKVAIGSYSRKNTLNHWNAMRSSPRRQVIQWHELR